MKEFFAQYLGRTAMLFMQRGSRTSKKKTLLQHQKINRKRLYSVYKSLRDSKEESTRTIKDMEDNHKKRMCRAIIIKWKTKYILHDFVSGKTFKHDNETQIEKRYRNIEK